MDMLNPHTFVTLPAGCRNRFCGIAFDGCFFYLTAPQDCSIYTLKRDFTAAGNINTDKPYNHICYDNTENCFWATADKHSDVIYKLDRNFREIGLLQVKTREKDCLRIVGLSYNCEKNLLLAAFGNQIAEVSKESSCAVIIHEACEGFYTAVLSIAPFYAAILQDGECQKLQMFNREGCPVKSFSIPALYSIKDILFYPCNERCLDEFEFILLAEERCRRQKVLLCSVGACGMAFCPCNYDVCDACCGKGNENERCFCDIIESIALVETSLSHILNAEGEKLQKAVELADSIDELLAVNRSVTKTIITITQLEHQLYLKLDALNDLHSTRNHNNSEMK